VDQPRVAAQRLLRPGAEALGDAGREAVHEDVGRVDQRRQRRAPGLGAQVEHDPALVAVGDVELAALALDVVDAAPLVAGGRLDLHDVGAHLAQRHRGERAAEVVGEVDHPDAGQGADGGDGLGHDGPPVDG
jgi:hypothetical protein